MTAQLAFKPSSLARELALRGLSAEAFATEIKVDRSTIGRALRGEGIGASTFGKILKYFADHPRIDVPTDLVEGLA